MWSHEREALKSTYRSLLWCNTKCMQCSLCCFWNIDISEWNTDMKLVMCKVSGICSTATAGKKWGYGLFGTVKSLFCLRIINAPGLPFLLISVKDCLAIVFNSTNVFTVGVFEISSFLHMYESSVSEISTRHKTFQICWHESLTCLVILKRSFKYLNPAVSLIATSST